jgi:O-antigen ligase
LLLDERIEIKKNIWFFSLGLIIPCFLGWRQFLMGWSPASTLFGLAEHLAATPGTSVVEVVGGRIMRAYGTFPHPNIFGGFLAAAILLILWRSRAWLWVKKKTWVATLPLLMLLSATLVITFSRSAWLALGTGIILIFIWHIIQRIKISKVFLLNFFVIFATVFITAGIFHDAVFVRVEATDRLEEKSLVERKSEYQIVGEVIKTNLFVGVGPGAYTFVLEELNPDQPIWFYQPIHNSLLLFFAETGLLGLVVLIYFFGAFVSKKNFFFVIPAIPIVVFDHYLWSQWAGLVLISMIFAIMIKFTIHKF